MVLNFCLIEQLAQYLDKPLNSNKQAVIGLKTLIEVVIIYLKWIS